MLMIEDGRLGNFLWKKLLRVLLENFWGMDGTLQVLAILVWLCFISRNWLARTLLSSLFKSSARFYWTWRRVWGGCQSSVCVTSCRQVFFQIILAVFHHRVSDGFRKVGWCSAKRCWDASQGGKEVIAVTSTLSMLVARSNRSAVDLNN